MKVTRDPNRPAEKPLVTYAAELLTRISDPAGPSKNVWSRPRRVSANFTARGVEAVVDFLGPGVREQRYRITIEPLHEWSDQAPRSNEPPTSVGAGGLA